MILFFDTSGLFVSPLPWLKNEKGEKKRILLHALAARLPTSGSPSIAILEHITHITVLLDYSKTMVKAILREFSGESLFQYLDKVDFSQTFIHVCVYHFLQMGRRKIKEILKNTKNNFPTHFVQRILGRLNATLVWKKLDVLWKIFKLS